MRQSHHGVERCCKAVQIVLAGNVDYGVPIPGHSGLRKMRVHVPAARLGKRGGYRCIYRKARIDEIDYVVFLDVFFKGDVEDLNRDQYNRLRAESDEILGDPLGVDWEDASPS
jgi:hypothetical protein